MDEYTTGGFLRRPVPERASQGASRIHSICKSRWPVPHWIRPPAPYGRKWRHPGAHRHSALP